MSILKTVEIKAFVPSKDFQLSQQFYQDIDFKKCSEGGGVAYFCIEHCAFLLQDFCAEGFAENFMMHLLVEDVATWYDKIQQADIVHKYSSKVSGLTDQPWRMRDFVFSDPSGVLWRIGQNID